MLRGPCTSTMAENFYGNLPPFVLEALKKNKSQILECVNVRRRTYDRGKSYELRPTFRNISNAAVHFGTLYYEEYVKRKGPRLGFVEYNTSVTSGETTAKKAIWFDNDVTEVYFFSMDDQPVRRHECLHVSPLRQPLAALILGGYR